MGCMLIRRLVPDMRGSPIKTLKYHNPSIFCGPQNPPNHSKARTVPKTGLASLEVLPQYGVLDAGLWGSEGS